MISPRASAVRARSRSVMSKPAARSVQPQGSARRGCMLHAACSSETTTGSLARHQDAIPTGQVLANLAVEAAEECGDRFRLAVPDLADHPAPDPHPPERFL